MAQRNYACDSLIGALFGTPSDELDSVGELVFKKQLYLCMAAAALTVKTQIEQYRSTNVFGLLTWQLNEIWPTGGWGSLEYGSPTEDGSQVLGGRWKPLHYLFNRSVYTDVHDGDLRRRRHVLRQERPGQRLRHAGIARLRWQTEM